jgi:hypothetical protein
MATTAYRLFLRRFAMIVALLLSLIAAFNYLIDPYGLFGRPVTAGFDQQKEGVRSYIRFTKALQLPLRRPATILLGSSRVHDGMNPEDPLLAAYQPVYNLGINMLRIKEALRYVRHATENAPVKRLIFGLDLFMFNGKEIENPSLDDDLVGRRVRWLDYLYRPLLSKSAVMGSVSTIEASRAQPGRREFLSNGYRPGQFVNYRLLDYRKLHAYTNLVFLSRSVTGTPYYGVFSTDEGTYRDFVELLALCRAKGIETVLFISPAHATLDGEVVRQVGLWDVMENWKRRIAAISAEYNVPLWDFSGYNSVTTEAVKTPMQYYWDSSHYTELVATMILGRILGKTPDGITIPGDFGILLTPSSNETHLAQIRLDREAYARTHPDEVALIQRLDREAISGKVDPDIAGMFGKN